MRGLETGKNTFHKHIYCSLNEFIRKQESQFCFKTSTEVVSLVAHLNKLNSNYKLLGTCIYISRKWG